MGLKDKIAGAMLENLLKGMDDEQKKDVVRQAIIKVIPAMKEKEREALLKKSLSQILDAVVDPDKRLKILE